MATEAQVSGTIRAFIAAGISEEVRSRVGELQTRLRETGAEVKWARPAAMHLTLRFLGDIHEDQIVPADEAMAKAAAEFVPVKVEVKGFGMFPNERRPRVIWIGLAEGGPELMAIFRKLESGLLTAGFAPADKPFSPHLTLGRVRTPRNLDLVKKVLAKEAAESFGQYEVDRITLFQSELRPEGAKYTALKERNLGDRE